MLGAILTGLMALLGSRLTSLASFRAASVEIGLLIAASLAVYAAAAVFVSRRPSGGRMALGVIVLVAVAARLVLVPSPGVLSDDVYRYVWDGRVAAADVNPYRYAPSDPALERLRDDVIYPRINRKDAPTIYPPASQGLFRAVNVVYPDSIRAVKLALILVELAAIGLLAALLARVGLARERVLLYAWHPLAVVEVAHGAHVDVFATVFLLLAFLAFELRRPVLAGVSIAAAGLVKLYPLAAAPALATGRRRSDLVTAVALAATFVLAYVPFLSVGVGVLGYLPGYVDEQGFSSGSGLYVPKVLGQLGVPFDVTTAYQVAAVALLGALALWFVVRPAVTTRDAATRGMLLLLLMIVLASPVQPWYRLVPLALLPLARGPLVWVAHLFFATALFSYFHTLLPSHPYWPRQLTYGGTIVALLILAAWMLIRRRPARTLRPRPAARTATAPTRTL